MTAVKAAGASGWESLRTSPALSGLVLLAYGSLFGCVTAEPLMINLKPGAVVQPDASLEGCSVEVVNVVDERLRKNDLGNMGFRAVLTGDVGPWLQEAFGSLQNRTMSTMPSPVEVSSHRHVSLTPRVKKLHMHALPSTVSANVVVAVDYTVDRTSSGTRTYRGTETSVNWTGSADFVTEVFDDALATAIKSIRVDLVNLCRGQKLS